MQQLLNYFDPILIPFDAVYAADASNASGKKYRCIISDNDIWFSKSITYQYSREYVLLFRKSEILLFKVLITNMLHKESLGEFPSWDRVYTAITIFMNES